MRPSIQTGFSLVEVLITMVILGIAVTGLTGAQLAVLRSARQTAQQEQALRLAREAADLLTAYRRSGAPDLPALTTLDHHPDTPGSVTLPGCFVARCDAATLVSAELQVLLDRLTSSLPEARLRICHDHAPWDPAGKAWKWECDGGASAGSEGEPLVVKIGWRDLAQDGTAPGQGMRVSPAPRVVLSLHGETK